jgi:hypothetical protein
LLFAVFLHRGILAVPSTPTPVWSWCTFDLAIPSRAQPEFFSKNSLAGAVFPVCSALNWAWRAPAGRPGHGGILVPGPGRGGWGAVGTARGGSRLHVLGWFLHPVFKEGPCNRCCGPSCSSPAAS